jgi:hypothetical protein
MARNLLRIPPELSLQDAVDDYFMRYDHGVLPDRMGVSASRVRQSCPLPMFERRRPRPAHIPPQGKGRRHGKPSP